MICWAASSTWPNVQPASSKSKEAIGFFNSECCSGAAVTLCCMRSGLTPTRTVSEVANPLPRWRFRACMGPATLNRAVCRRAYCVQNAIRDKCLWASAACRTSASAIALQTGRSTETCAAKSAARRRMRSSRWQVARAPPDSVPEHSMERGNASVDGIAAGRSGCSLPKIGNHFHRILKPLQQPRRYQGAIAQLLQPALEHRERTPQVSAVDTRHITRLGRLQRAGVVPIVEVASMPLKTQHALQHAGGAIQQNAGAQIAQIIGRQAREQRQTDVRRRGAGS